MYSISNFFKGNFAILTDDRSCCEWLCDEIEKHKILCNGIHIEGLFYVQVCLTQYSHFANNRYFYFNLTLNQRKSISLGYATYSESWVKRLNTTIPIIKVSELYNRLT